MRTQLIFALIVLLMVSGCGKSKEETEIEQYHSQNLALETRAKNLSAEVSDRDQKAKVLEDKNATMQAKLDLLTSDVASSNLTISTLSSNAAKNEEKIKLLDKQMLEVSEKISALLNAIASRDDDKTHQALVDLSAYATNLTPEASSLIQQVRDPDLVAKVKEYSVYARLSDVTVQSCGYLWLKFIPDFYNNPEQPLLLLAVTFTNTSKVPQAIPDFVVIDSEQNVYSPLTNFFLIRDSSLLPGTIVNPGQWVTGEIAFSANKGSKYRLGFVWNGQPIIVDDPSQ
jgi:hypothetical protein